MTINPAFAGQKEALYASSFYNRQWTGIKGAPESWSFCIDAPLNKNKVGLGMLLAENKYGTSKNIDFFLNYAFKINLQSGVLGFGLGAGVTISNTSWSDLTVIDLQDPLYLIQTKVLYIPNFSFGAVYNQRQFFVGFSIPRFLNYKYDFQKNKNVLTSDPRQYNFLLHSGYTFIPATKIKITPSILMNYSIANKLMYDINIFMEFADRYGFGFSYQNNRSLTGILQLGVFQQFKLAYAYGFDLGYISKFSNGSHQICLNYVFKYKMNVASPLNL